MLDEAWIYIAGQQLLHMPLRPRENGFQTWKRKLRSLLDVSGDAFDDAMGDVDLPRSVGGGVHLMYRGESLSNLVQKAIISVDLLWDI